MKNERQIAAIPAHVEYEAKERQLQLEVELEKQANRIQALETQVDALRAQIALDRRGYKRFTQAVRHALDRLPGGSRLIGLYSAWKAPSLSDFAVSADVPEAIANLAADRTATLFSDWHVGSVRAAKQVADDGELVDISISVVLYNSSQWIESFTSSLLRSNYPQDKISVVFVDNGSTDDTVDKVTSWIQNFGTDFSGVTLLRRKNDGYGAGNDSAIALCKTEFVLVTNVDVDFDPDLLRRIVAAAVSDSADVGCWEAMQTPYQHPKYHDPVTLLTNWCSHACVLFRKSAYISAGGYEKRLFMYGEDVELSYRLRAAGWRLRYVPFARLVHHNDISDQKLRPLQLSGSLAANVLLSV
ncbi:glycosyltransferase family 2 protein [Mesorhizobium sp. PAMC28654]|uniref:glycosyltransferase family 2 protein n=1 Tax=Mesorhizobium sp. PAMC28654 TaxID=2880934 RepID=UPI001D0B56BA|nr:glycosyltransferase family 2 protein [Mesorhizobium sp. PAMC28654]UDL91626.1 glycosyltransferase family 2 protein [Mesorhizobium sp. PAMC28654]